MSLVAAMEFVGTIGVALWGCAPDATLAALALAVLGVFLLIDIRWSSDPVGWPGRFSTAPLRRLHRAGAPHLGDRRRPRRRTARCGNGTGLRLRPAGRAGAGDRGGSARDTLVLAGIGVRICSSVIPYVCDQPPCRDSRGRACPDAGAAAGDGDDHRRHRAGADPKPADLLGVALVMAGVAPRHRRVTRRRLAIGGQGGVVGQHIEGAVGNDRRDGAVAAQRRS